MVADLVGREIKGRYKLVDERGSGNFGTVYIVRDLLTNYLYAAKVMRIDHTDDNELVERFKREAVILYGLNDPHIVRVIDYGNEGQIYYIIMHHIDGQNLKYYMQNYGVMEPLRALDYTHQAAEGLDAAFKRGVVHRDIKPQNILINNKGILKIVDFGLSRSREMLTITHSDKFMGTAYYVAPEQVTNSHEVDTRADLYALSAMLFEMLTGNPPYTEGSALDIILKHTRAEIPSICRQRPDLPPDVEAFMQKALAKDPAARFQSPAEYIRAIERLQQCIRGEVAKPQPQACLILVEGGQSFPLVGSQMIIGRPDPRREVHPDILIHDEHKTVGRVHACLSCQQGHWSIEDRNSRNKTRLNGEILLPYTPKPLKDGDLLRFGRIEARFVLR
ncbi:MAG TPA: FHA domain-containing serine/threonine-protein kinase [Ktedonobacteraceae bacterium]|nr:FHA domain-containing serine/threonine-protein kinase [Ktedonobacteraceae bacterium]